MAKTCFYCLLPLAAYVNVLEKKHACTWESVLKHYSFAYLLVVFLYRYGFLL